jgi:hypothetical protein
VTNTNDGDPIGAKPRPNVSFVSFLWPLALVAWGAYRLTRSGDLSHAATLWYAFVCVTGLLLVGASLLAKFGPNPQNSAQKLDEMNQRMYGGVHRRRAVPERMIADYKLDAGFYDQATGQLQSLGFRRLPDFIDTDAEEAAPWGKTVLRPFLSGDGTVMAAVYTVRFTGWTRLLVLVMGKIRVIDLETELSDGTFVATSTATQAGKTLEFPGVSRRFFPPTMPAADLLSAHQEHLLGVLAQKEPGVGALVLRSPEDLFASQDRQQLLKNHFRNSSQFDAAAEIERVAGKPLSDVQQEMASEVGRLHANRAAPEPPKPTE